MPFGSITGSDKPKAILESADAKTFKLLNELPYYIRTDLVPRIVADTPAEGTVTGKRDEPLYTVVAEAEFTRITALPHAQGDRSVTDLASIPWFLWSLLGPYGRQLRPALLHDRLCERAAFLRDCDDDRRAGRRVRRDADDTFRRALSDEGVWWYRRWIFWAGVSIGRYCGYLRFVAFLLILQITASVVSVYAGIFHLFAGSYLLGAGLVAAPIALSFAWLTEFRLPLVATFAGPIVFPFAIAALLAALLLWFPDMVVWFLERARTRKPQPFPEALPRRRLVR